MTTWWRFTRFIHAWCIWLYRTANRLLVPFPIINVPVEWINVSWTAVQWRRTQTFVIFRQTSCRFLWFPDDLSDHLHVHTNIQTFLHATWSAFSAGACRDSTGYGTAGMCARLWLLIFCSLPQSRCSCSPSTEESFTTWTCDRAEIEANSNVATHSADQRTHFKNVFW